MEILFYLFIIIAIIFTGFIFYIVKVIKEDNWDKSLKFLNIMVKFGLVTFIIVQIILTTIALFYINDGLLIFITVIKQIITTTFFIFIYIKTVSLLENLNNNKIFLKDNSILSKEIGLNFLYLSITEILVGFALGVMLYSSTGSFNIATNNTIFVYILIGLVLQIFSKILYKATEIHNENQLTI